MTIFAQLKSLWDPAEELRQQARPDATHEPALGSLPELRLALKHAFGPALPGVFPALIKGHGLDFDTLREYQPGDEVRRMDWASLARTGRPYIREYQAEIERTCWFFWDNSPSMGWGHTQSKASFALRLLTLLMVLAQDAHYKVGLCQWTSEGPSIIKRPGPQALAHALHATPTAWPAQGRKPSESTSFPRLDQWLTSRDIVFFLSDFVFLGQDPEARQILHRLGRHQASIYLYCLDPHEVEWPTHVGWLPLQTDQGPLWVNPSSPVQHQAIAHALHQPIETTTAMVKQLGGHLLLCRTDVSPTAIIRQLAREAQQ